MPAESVDDAFLVLEQRGSRSALQSADVILGEVASMNAAVRWIDATFAAYPGCVVAGAYHERGEWALFATRTGVRMLLRAKHSGLSSRSIGAVAHLVYAELVWR